MKKFIAKVQAHYKDHKKLYLIIGSLVLLLAIVGGTYLVLQNKGFIKRNDLKSATKDPEPIKPATKPSVLTGNEVEPALAERPITAVMIENSFDARPQSGLSHAGVVYEALAEGGITRFIAFFQEHRPGVIGPVRSIRQYFVSWALEYDAPLAHVGGNATAMDMVAPLGVKSINQFYNGGSYYRTTDRYAPHNAYTNSDLLDALIQAKGYFNTPTVSPFPRKDDTPPTAEQPAPHTVITINYSYTGFQAQYRYDAATNDYVRYLAGVPHIDRNTGQPIRVKNIVVEYMPTSYGKTRVGEQSTIMGTPGSGQVIVFRDGTAVGGTWSKPGHRERTKLTDAAGAEIKLNRGNTWFSIVPVGNSVTY